MRKENKLYIADEGKIFVRKDDKEVKAKTLLLAVWDSIDNYEEIDEVVEEVQDVNI